MNFNISKFDVLAGAAIAGGVFGMYKLIKYMIDADKEAEELKIKFEKEKNEELAIKDYRSLIRQASTFNPHLDAHQRNIAFDMLQDIWESILNDTKWSELEDDLDNLNTCLDILLGDDEIAILATIDRKIRAEESRKIRAQREHELALAKAAGENELKVAQIAADAETTKASLYSEGIKGVANILKEVKDERNEESDD